MESNQLGDVRQRLHGLRTEKARIRNRTDSLTQQLMEPVVASEAAWNRLGEGDGIEYNFEIDTKSSIREELEKLEGRERNIDEAIKGGMSVEDRLLSEESLKACVAKRPEIVAAVKEQLLALRGVEKANRKLRRIRDGIESDGFRTGSLPIASYDVGGRWNDRCGGRLVESLQRDCTELPRSCEVGDE